MSFRLRQLTFRYAAAQPAVLDIGELDLEPGQTVGLLGPSGSGKTTLLNLLGLLLPAGGRPGTVRYRSEDGSEYDYAGLTRRQEGDLRLRDFGFVLQTCYLLPHFSCMDNVALPLALQGAPRTERRRRAELLLEAAGDPELFRLRQRHGGEVSLGQKQRVAVLRAVAHNPRVVFADEPTSNLDQKNTDQMFDLLGRWRRGDFDPTHRSAARTLLLVCHHLPTALCRADRLVVLDGEHRVAASFARGAWPEHADRVNRLLGTVVPSAFPLEPRP